MADHVESLDKLQVPLILKKTDLAARTAHFYAELKASEQLQRDFTSNPTGVLAKKFLSADAVKDIPPQRVSNANRILFSILANDQFRTWMQNYQAAIEKSGKFDKGQVDRDVSDAVIRYGDAAFVQGLMESTIDDGGPASMSVLNVNEVVAVCYIFAAAVAVIIIVIFAGIVKHDGFSPADFRNVIERMVANAKALDKAGTLRESHVR